MNDDEIFVSCARGGSFFGEHSVVFDDNDSTIKIEHIAKNRSSFAKGSIDAAKWLFKKKSGFFTFNDMLKDLYGYKYDGSYTAILTPFKADFSVDSINILNLFSCKLMQKSMELFCTKQAEGQRLNMMKF